MAKPFDPQLKQEIITAVKSGSMTQAEACRLYGVKSAAIEHLVSSGCYWRRKELHNAD